MTRATETPAPDTADHPPHWEADVVAADGGVLHLRPIAPADADALVAFHARLSERTRYLRYFSAYPRIPERDLVRFTHVDHRDRVAFVAVLGGEIIAVGRYEREPGTDEAEVAFVVADAHQGRGIGSVLLEHLAAAARERGIRRFVAIVLAENPGMIRVFRDAGYQATTSVEYGEVTLTFDVAETETTETVRREREQRAEARSISAAARAPARSLSSAPATIRARSATRCSATCCAAASRAPSTRSTPRRGRCPGCAPTRACSTCRTTSTSPSSRSPRRPSRRSSRSARPAACADWSCSPAGSASAVTTPSAPLVRRCSGRWSPRRAARGMRVVGPNCLGVINTDPSVRLNASLAPLSPARGRAGFFAQSGALGVAVLGEASRRGLGVSTFVSAGNRADVSGNDLLQYWETDEATDVVLMYLESFGNPRKFARLARRLGRRKPIVAVKSCGSGGRPARGRRRSRCRRGACRRCSRRPASSGSRPSATCSTSRCCSDGAAAAARRTASRWWATRRRWRCWCATRWTRRG